MEGPLKSDDAKNDLILITIFFQSSIATIRVMCNLQPLICTHSEVVVSVIFAHLRCHNATERKEKQNIHSCSHKWTMYKHESYIHFSPRTINPLMKLIQTKYKQADFLLHYQKNI